MTDERWREVKALFQATVERPPAERADFLAAAAGGDEAIRREVESLLSSERWNQDITNRLPVQGQSPWPDSLGAASPPYDPTPSDTFSTAVPNIGPYRIVGRLGAGGMGEVFRARDSSLNREVALKVLPSAFELDPERLDAIPARSADARRAQSSTHCCHLRTGTVRQSPGAGARARRGRHAGGADRRGSPSTG